MVPIRSAPLILVLVAACGGAAPPVRPPVPTGPVPAMRAHFIDVGQGDATLLEMPCAAVLIDTGGELNDSFDSVAALRDYLDAFFARRTDLDGAIDLLVITHPHIDHTRGIPMVLGRYRVKHVIDNGQERSSGKAEAIALHEWVRAHPDVGYEDIHADRALPGGATDATIDPIRCPDIDPEIHVLWGTVDRDPGWHADRYGKRPFDNENNHSVVVRVDFGRSSFLFPGDLEEAAIDDLVHAYAATRLLDIDVYKVGHHGSRNGTTPSEVAAMTPRIAVISMGSPMRRWEWTAWQYGHPNKGIVKLLAEHVSARRRPVEEMVGSRAEEFDGLTVDGAVYGTGWDGTIVIEADARGKIQVVAPAR
jgi:competence protein ComEC